MKKVIFNIAMMMAAVNGFAQVTVQEPEFVGSYNLLTSDTTFDVLPKESGEIQEHKNKVSKWAKIAGAASRVAGAAGVLGMSTAGSMGGRNGIQCGAGGRSGQRTCGSRRNGYRL